MTLSDSTRFALILSLLTARVVSQVTKPPVAISSEYYCPLVSSFSTLRACASYANSFSVACAHLYTASKTADYLSCFCDPGLYSLEALCYAELADCAGLGPNTFPGNALCSGELGGPLSSGLVIATGSTSTSSGGLGPSSTSARATPASSRSTSSGSTITATPSARTSSTQAPASSVPSSAQSSATAARPMSSVLYLMASLVIMAAMV